MTTREIHSVGAPCWVDTFQPDPRAAMDNYGPLFGWSFDDPTPMPTGLEGDYLAARLRGRLVAGIGQAPDSWAMSSLHTTDVERAQAFYGAMFDWELESVPDAAFSLWRRSGRVVAVVTATDGVAVPPHWSVNFSVRDADSIARHAIALGGTILMAPMNTPGFRSAVIGDPQGGVIAVSAAAG